MIIEFPAQGTRQVDKGDLFWDTTPNSSAKFKHHKKSENVKFEGTKNAIFILVAPEVSYVPY